MTLEDESHTRSSYNIVSPAAHTLHDSRDAQDFCRRFAAFTGQSVHDVVNETVHAEAPKTAYLTGSIPLGMATHGSDVDLVVLIDDKTALIDPEVGQKKNTDRSLAFANESELVRAGLFLRVMNGVTVEVSVAMMPVVKRIYQRLRGKGPEMSEVEIMTLSRISTGWLLWQTDDHLQRAELTLPDPALDIYCSTKHFSYSLIYKLKARRALELDDVPQALYLGRSSVEAAYLAYFASEGMSYLGAKWLAQIGHARGAPDRVRRYPLLKEGIPLLFPSYGPGSDPETYLRATVQFLHEMRDLIEQKMLFRIAFSACPQIYPI